MRSSLVSVVRPARTIATAAVETFVAGAGAGNLEGRRLFAGSNRDYGIQIFQYAGDK